MQKVLAFQHRASRQAEELKKSLPTKRYIVTEYTVLARVPGVPWLGFDYDVAYANDALGYMFREIYGDSYQGHNIEMPIGEAGSGRFRDVDFRVTLCTQSEETPFVTYVLNLWKNLWNKRVNNNLITDEDNDIHG